MRKFLYILFLSFCWWLCSAQSPDDIIISSTVEFVVNTDTFVKNDDYYTFINYTIPFIKENSNKITKILLIGSASPEGTVQRNIELANLRANKIYNYISNDVSKEKVMVENDYNLFLEKTHLTENNYEKLRATFIEIFVKEEKPIQIQVDTVYIKETYRDTIYCWNTIIDTIYIEKLYQKIPVVALKTNLLSDAIITPNVQAEVYTYLWNLSLEFDYTFPWWRIDEDKYFYHQILNGTAGIRKYFKNDYTGHYIGIYGNTAIYDLCYFNKEKGWQGEAYGAGFSYGYVFKHKKYSRLRFEPYVKVGWLNTRFDTYHASQPFNGKYYYNWFGNINDFVPRRFTMNYFGPTAIGFNLTYDLICVRKY